VSSLEEIQNARLKKLAFLKDAGIDPFPSTVARIETLKEVQTSFDTYTKEEKNIVADGRIMGMRGQGGLAFVDIFDGSDSIQVILKKDVIGDDSFTLFKDTMDVGDFIECTGKLMMTNRGERSIVGESWRILTKSIRPIPGGYYSLEDKEELLRKRYLDILIHPETRALFLKRAHFWRVTRAFFEERSFLEVETPTLEVTTGGAEARPFKTHHNDFDIDLFLRISVGELWQKRLMASGIPRTFEIGRVYRNEGTSDEHVQEFTNAECYAAFLNIKEGKDLVRTLYQKIAHEVFDTYTFTTRGHRFDLSGDTWDEIDYVDTIKEKIGVDVSHDSEEALKKALEERNVLFEGSNRERLTDSLWKYVRKDIAGPVFLINHPKLVAPLSKDLAGSEGNTEMFQVIIAGSEVGRAHAELNDPQEQEARLKGQQELVDRGDEEAMMFDTEFIEMLEYGMPPTFGFGFGERLFAFMADVSVREAQIFPLMKPKE